MSTSPVQCCARSSARSAADQPAITDLSIIIVNWNSASYLRPCLASIYEYTTGLSFDIIVIDNASYDGSAKMVSESFPEVRYIQCESNLGFARANNFAARSATADVLLFLNPDTAISSEVFAKMLAHLRSHSSLGAVGPRLLNSDGSLQTSCVQAFPNITNQLLNSDFLQTKFPAWRVWGMNPLFNPLPAAADAISGACFMVKRRLFEAIGGFTEAYFMYSEDIDLSYKLREAGYVVHVLNDCCVIHHGGKSSSHQHDNFANLAQLESLAIFFARTRGSLYCLGYRISMAGLSIARILLIVFLMLSGRKSIQGSASGTVLRKWINVFRWAVRPERSSPVCSAANMATGQK